MFVCQLAITKYKLDEISIRVLEEYCQWDKIKIVDIQGDIFIRNEKEVPVTMEKFELPEDLSKCVTTYANIGEVYIHDKTIRTKYKEVYDAIKRLNMVQQNIQNRNYQYENSSIVCKYLHYRIFSLLQ